MKLPMPPFYLFIIAIFVISGAVFAWRYFSAQNQETLISVVEPELSNVALSGKAAFKKNCAQCHGTNAAGSDHGPPLVHDIYNPGHHGDTAFYQAVELGTRSHHWPFGDMPPQPHVSDEEVAAIVRYVREMQEANGIFYREHHM